MPAMNPKLCEDCGRKHKNYGIPGQEKRWCGGCAKKHGGVIHCGVEYISQMPASRQAQEHVARGTREALHTTNAPRNTPKLHDIHSLTMEFENDKHRRIKRARCCLALLP